VDRFVVDVTGSVGSDGEEESSSAQSMSERRHNEKRVCEKECEAESSRIEASSSEEM